MAQSINHVTLLGRVGIDPEIRAAGSGRVANFSLATSVSWKKPGDDQWQEKTQWHKIAAWQNEKGPRLVDTVEKYVNKGDVVLIEGEIEYRSWDDRDGNKRYVTEIKAHKIIPLGRPAFGGASQAVPAGHQSSGDGEPAEITAARAEKQAREAKARAAANRDPKTFEDFPEALDAEDDNLPF